MSELDTVTAYVGVRAAFPVGSVAHTKYVRVPTCDWPGTRNSYRDPLSTALVFDRPPRTSVTSTRTSATASTSETMAEIRIDAFATARDTGTCWMAGGCVSTMTNVPAATAQLPATSRAVTRNAWVPGFEYGRST